MPTLRERRWVGRLVHGLWLRDRRGHEWPVPDWLPYEVVRFEGNMGADIAGRWFASKDPKGTVVLAHPDRRYAQHWFVMAGWVDFLRDAHYNVLTFDFPGYGASTGGSAYFFEDVIAAARWAKRRAPARPLHLVGLSQGAFHVANAAPHLDFVESLVLESPYPSLRAWYGRRLAQWPVRAMDWLFPTTSRMIRADKQIARANARRILVAAPADDDVTPAALSEAVARAGPRRRTRFFRVPHARHLEAFNTSAAYRSAILATLAGTGTADGAIFEDDTQNVRADQASLRKREDVDVPRRRRPDHGPLGT